MGGAGHEDQSMQGVHQLWHHPVGEGPPCWRGTTLLERDTLEIIVTPSIKSLKSNSIQTYFYLSEIIQG